MNCNKICFLCISKCIDSFTFDTQICDQQLKEILVQHFWFREFDETLSNRSEEICADCFGRVNEFYEFFTNIRNIHLVETRPNTTGINLLDNIETKIDPKLLLTDIGEYNLPENESLRKGRRKKSKSIEIDMFDEIEPLVDIPGTDTQPDDNVKSSRRKRKGKTESESDSPEKLEKECSASEKLRRFFDEQKEKVMKHFSFHCEFCPAPLDSLYHAQNHYKSEHNCPGYLMCCNRRFLRYKTIFDHLEWHDNPNAFRCVTCGKTFQTSVCLRKHYNQAHNPKNQGPYECETCNKTFSRKNCFRIHNRSQHPVDGKRFKCNECQKLFATEPLLKDHIRRSHVTKYVCDLCAKTFKTQKSYDLHYRVVHAKDLKRVQCDLCGAWLKHDTALYEHIHRIHKGQNKKTYACEYCDKKLKIKSSLNRHIALVHSNISFPCPDCGKTFKSIKSLQEHVAIHMGITDLYTCSFCPRTFRSSSNMLTHRKHDHPVEYVQLKMNGK